MASIKTNIEFFKSLLSEASVSDRHRRALLDLMNNYLENELVDKNELEKLQDELVQIRESKAKQATAEREINTNHDPIAVRDLLRFFGDPSKLKYTTHDWDYVDGETKRTMDSELFYADVRKVFFNEMRPILEKLMLSDLRNLLYNFLLKDYSVKLKENGGYYSHPFNEHGWGEEWLKKSVRGYDNKTPGVKMGWSHSGLKQYLIGMEGKAQGYEVPLLNRPVQFKKEFWNIWIPWKNEKKELSRMIEALNEAQQKQELQKELDKHEENEKLPIEEDVNREYRENQDFEPGISSYHYFENVIGLFKKCIEFRDSDFKKILQYLFSSAHDSRLENWEIDSSSVIPKAGFYVHTEKVLEALTMIVSNFIQRKEVSRKIEIQVGETDETLTLSITHVDSFNTYLSSRDQTYVKGIKGSNNNFIYRLRECLRSVCDLSICSRFNNDGTEEELELVYLDSTGDRTPNEGEILLEEKLANDVKGFTIKMKFYL